MVRRGDLLLHNLPQLQNLIKRDPQSYHEEFLEQKKSFESTIKTFELAPEVYNKSLDELTNFMAQIAKCYPTEMADFPKDIINLLNTHNTVLDNSMRMSFCTALVLLRNKNILEPMVLLELFFNLLRSNDKNLRAYLKIHLVTDIKNLNEKHKNVTLNTKLQNFMYTMLKDPNTRAVKMSLDVMIELYRKNVWNDAKTVNVIATGCFSKITKVMVASLKFFLGRDDDDIKEDSDSENEVDLREVMMANKFNKQSRKRDKQLDKAKKLTVKAQKKKSKAPIYNFSALHLVHDPQGMAEKLLHQLETGNTKRFEVKLMILDVISRLIGLHNLIIFNFYPYIQRFLQPHQREVTRILLFAAQASHELVPPDVLESVLGTITNKFISEHNSSDVMAIGLNAVREICSRCPLAMNETLLSDLAQFKTYRERSVMMASCSLISLFRHTRPELLSKKFRGRPTDATKEFVSKQYAELDAKDYIPGAEILLKKQTPEIDVNSDSGSDDEEWIDLPSDGEDGNGDDTKESEDIDDEEEDDKEKDDENDSNETGGEKLTKQQRAQKMLSDRILTDEDFKRIEAENIRKQVQYTNKGQKRKTEEAPSELVRLGDIENIYKKRKHDKQTRIESVRKGQEDREKFGYKDGRMNIHCSKTNREKNKTKNYQMLKPKMRGKTKRSFRDKQIALRNYLTKQKKMR